MTFDPDEIDLEDFDPEIEERVCCAGCGRDTVRVRGDRFTAYCHRCIDHGLTHLVPEDLDRKPLKSGPLTEDELTDDEDDDFRETNGCSQRPPKDGRPPASSLPSRRLLTMNA
jgi:hypothetical protein